MTESKKFKIAKLAIILTATTITIIAIVWLILQNHPISLDTIANLTNGTLEIHCKFAN